MIRRFHQESETELVRDEISVHSFGAMRKKWVLWHLTGRCNIECDYCYGSFQGGSYKKNYRISDDVPLPTMLETADAISDLGFEYVHLNGGEPFLRSDMWQIIERLAKRNLKVWLLTNATFVTQNFTEHFEKGWLECLSFSIDSIRREYGNYVRAKTQTVTANIEHIARLKKQLQLDTFLGIYMVLTRRNLDLVDELFKWAVEIGIGYINIQTVCLPQNHPMHDELCLTQDHYTRVMEILSGLQSLRGKIRTSSNALVNLTRHLMAMDGIVAKACFANRGDYLYIGPTGNVHGCPSMPPSANTPWGNISYVPLRSIVESREFDAATQVCPFVSLDCLGMYEMAYQRDYSDQ